MTLRFNDISSTASKSVLFFLVLLGYAIQILLHTTLVCLKYERHTPYLHVHQFNSITVGSEMDVYCNNKFWRNTPYPLRQYDKHANCTRLVKQNTLKIFPFSKGDSTSWCSALPCIPKNLRFLGLIKEKGAWLVFFTPKFKQSNHDKACSREPIILKGYRTAIFNRKWFDDKKIE